MNCVMANGDGSDSICCQVKKKDEEMGPGHHISSSCFIMHRVV